MVSVPWGNFEDAAEDVRRSIVSAAEDARILIYVDYRLEPSPTVRLAPDPDAERLESRRLERK
jgi:hypothetical protein